ncbi:MAG: Trk system potassium transporter TrkA [Myxococcota bacterium]|jgi:trk system potassium uptake protein TrkA|nr:Trk system potassium transporter TrkA [Myxococcota bacterium]
MKAVVIGAGQVGSAIIAALSSEKIGVVAVDLSEQRLQPLADRFDIQTIVGSGSNPDVLAQAGVESADMVVAVTDSDEVNMVACTIAKRRAPNAIKVARIRERAFIDAGDVGPESSFGVDHAINPELVAAERLLEILEVPFASDVADLGYRLKLVGMRLPHGLEVDGISFAALRQLAPDIKTIVTTRVRGGVAIVPRGSDDIRGGDTLFLVGAPEDMPKVAQMFRLPWRPAKRITVAGGKGIGALLAVRLEASGKRSIKLIEPDPARADMLAQRLEKVLVLQGSATDESLLMEENIRDCDVFIAALPEAEANVMAALNAKRLGASRVIALTDRTAYIPIIQSAGIDAVVSPRAIAIGTILQHVRKGKVKAVVPYGDEGQAEAIRFEALETSAAVGKPFKDIHFPQGSIVGAIIRGEKALIPGGNDVLVPGDEVLVFAMKSAISKLEKLMTVRLDFF